MHTLHDLKNLLSERGFQITSFTGWMLVCNRDKWGLLHDEFYRNGSAISRKDIMKYIKETPKVPSTLRIIKKMIPKNYKENDYDDQSN